MILHHDAPMQMPDATAEYLLDATRFLEDRLRGPNSVSEAD